MTKEEKLAKKEEGLKLFKELETEYTKKVQEKREHLKEMNGWKRFWFNVGQSRFCQWFRRSWLKYKCVHPKGAKLLEQVFFFLVFSNGVTIWQYLVMTFLPHLIGLKLAQTPFVWPAIPLGNWLDGNGNQLFFAIFNEPVIDKNGFQIVATGDLTQGVIGGGLGNFIAFEIAVFTAQCINFPLQRNITFKSDGNPYFQAMWYFIGWVGVSLFVNAVWGIANPIMTLWGWAPALKNLLKTFITGGISMVIFFFIFKIIFPPKKTEEVK
ncbi:MAG: hypothetical protein J1F32_06125 [Erysipelotrichales bacterium]|nr:hypothetical protein [Erysipelotrichales bacterium]